MTRVKHTSGNQKNMRDFRLPREEDENCALLGYYAASSGS